MDSQRLIINNYDLSTTSLTTTTTLKGFTVVKAPKGPITPVLISANSAQGATKQLKEVFGEWSKDYPELYEVEQFISGGYDCYVSAPYDTTNSKIPVAYLTVKGVFPAATLVTYNKNVEALVNGTDEPSIPGINDFTSTTPTILKNINYMKTYENIGTDDSSNYPSYNDSKLVIDTLLSASELESTLNATLYIKDAFSETAILTIRKDSSVWSVLEGTALVGTVDVSGSTALIKLSGGGTVVTADAIAALASEDKRKVITCYWAETVASSDIKATIFPKYVSERSTEISFRSFDANAGRDPESADTRNEFVLTAYDTGDGAYGNTGTVSSCTVHLDTQATDEEYKNNNIIAVCVINKFTSSETLRAISGYPAITLKGGERIFGANGVIHDAGWDEAADDEYSDVDVFFSTRSADTESSAFFSLAATHTLSGFIFNETIAPSGISSATPLNYGSQYWNICNEAKVVDATKGSIWSPMTGSRAKMQCDIIKNRWGGVAPMYLNSSGLGGQLSGMEKVKCLRYNYKKDVQMLLDAKNYNPVIKDSTYGIMVIGQKTCKSGAVTDWSYIGHVSAFLNFEKEIKNNVMIPQLGKANNDYYRALRAQQVEAYLAKRLQGSTRIWAAATVDTSTADGCNDAAARKARKFIINVKVKVDIFSEYVELNFVNVDQDTTI